MWSFYSQFQVISSKPSQLKLFNLFNNATLLHYGSVDLAFVSRY